MYLGRESVSSTHQLGSRAGEDELRTATRTKRQTTKSDVSVDLVHDLSFCAPAEENESSSLKHCVESRQREHAKDEVDGGRG
jgi:hypothetical protein